MRKLVEVFEVAVSGGAAAATTAAGSSRSENRVRG